MSELIKQACISCEAEFLGREPDLCCSGSDCGCQGLPIEPPLCEKCEDKFFGGKYPCVECGNPLTLKEISNEQHKVFCSHHCALTCVGFVITDNGYLPQDEADQLNGILQCTN